MTRLARCGSFHRLESSAKAFSSASRARALSTSKMPPQQQKRLLDLFDDGGDFRAHDAAPVADVTVSGAKRNARLARRSLFSQRGSGNRQ
jgi:hypothetical protein